MCVCVYTYTHTHTHTHTHICPNLTAPTIVGLGPCQEQYSLCTLHSPPTGLSHHLVKLKIRMPAVHSIIRAASNHV